MVASKVCFFKEFDSFTLESDYLEIVYGSKPFRFGHVTNHAGREFFIKSLDKIEVTLPEMLLQYEDQAGFGTAYVVNLCAVFDDALKFGSFVEKLTRIAGYHQVQLPDCELSTTNTSDSENEDDMNESGIDENILNEHQFVESSSEKEMNRPLITLTEGHRFRYTFDQRGFEVHHPETRTHWRFRHPAIRHRQFQANPPGRTARNRIRYLIRNVTLQTAVGARGAAQYVNMGPCDVEFDLPTSTHLNLTRLLDDNTYRYTAI